MEFDGKRHPGTSAPIVLLFLICLPAFAQTAQFTGKRIVAIDYAPAQVLDESDLARVNPLKVGGTLQESDVANAIDGLFSTGRFEDIAVEAEPAGDGVRLRIVTKLEWFIGGVTVQGKIVTPPNRAQLRSVGNIQLGTVFHDDDVAKSVTSIRNLLQANGLYEANVTPGIERDNTAQQVFLTFQVKPGKRAKYEMPSIESDTTDKKLSEATILRATGWRYRIVHIWKQVTDSRTRTGVASVLNKYQAQDRLTSSVELQKLDYDAKRRRVKPSLKIHAGPKITIKAVEAKVSKSKLRRYVPVYQEHTVDNDLLVEGRRNLSDYFQSQGYYDVEVEFRTLPEANDSQTIEYAISKGQKYKLMKLDITGNEYFRAEVIKERLFMTPASFSIRRGRYSEAFRRKDEQTIAALYQGNGFRDVKVSSTVDRDYNGKDGQVAVTIRVNEGPQWMVDELTLNGTAQVDKSAILPLLTSSPGQPFADVNLASDRNAALTYYFGAGYPAAAMKVEWQPTAVPNHVHVTYTVKEGERQYVRGVLRTGLRYTKPRLIEKAFTLNAGDPLSPIEQTNIQKRLYDLGVFARIDTAIENPDGNTQHKYILYNIEEANRYNFAVGFGAQVGNFGTPSSTSVQSAAGKAGFSPQVSLDVSRLNLLGHRSFRVAARSLLEHREARIAELPAAAL